MICVLFGWSMFDRLCGRVEYIAFGMVKMSV